MKYKGVNHLALATGDFVTTVRFWRDLLGMRLVAALGRLGYRQYFFEISADNMITFFEWPDIEPIAEKDAGRVAKGPLAFDHVAIGVDDDDALWELKDKLEANDMWVSEVMDNGFIHSIFTFDPNGISLEFCCQVKNIDIRSEPVMADASPPDSTREGPEAQPGQWKSAERTTPANERRIYSGELKKYFQRS